VSFVKTILATAAAFTALAAQASPVTLRVTVQNLAPANSISFAPLRVGFNAGTYDALNAGATAGAAIVSVAEGGSGSAWFPAFAAADPGAVLGTVVPNPAGALTPGLTGSAVFTFDAALNPFFTFAAMVVPSNDFFIGNDNPTQYRLFNSTGQLVLNTIEQTARDIWDAGSEAFDPANAAFLVVGNNAGRTPQNGVVNFNFAELTGFNGLTTAAGYVFNSALTADSPIYRISFAVVPEPGSMGLALAALLALGFVAPKRKPMASSPLAA
jgi:hypothetical protein